MEPESTSSQPPISTPVPHQPEPATDVQPAQPSAETSSIPDVPAEPPVQPAPPVQTAPVSPSAPVAPSVPPVSPSAPPAMTAPVSAPNDSHMTLITGVLLVSLLAGSVAAYYYWKMTTVEAVAVVSSEVATSTGSIALTELDPALRPTLERVIQNMNAALAQGSYEEFMKTVDTQTASELKKEDFEKTKSLLKGLMTVDLTTISFVDIQQDSAFAGYYFTATGTPDGKTPPALSFVRFVNEGGEWRIGKLYSKNISASDDIMSIIATDPEFSFSVTATTTTATTTNK